MVTTAAKQPKGVARIGCHDEFALAHAQQIALAHQAVDALGIDSPATTAQLGRDPRAAS